MFAKDRAELVAATRALDRVLLANHYMIPTWFHGRVWTARWDRFGRPDPMPTYGVTGFPTSGGSTASGRRGSRADGGLRFHPAAAARAGARSRRARGSRARTEQANYLLAVLRLKRR